ncbi:hypothetical protein GALL_430070 [mine drainage metagenome]|uniref:Uncharacterized protein n=1 Tax=mine drainage metagenome TaxID=410659 RepID=A0A1J5PUP0_9ZZZZ
MGMNMHLYMRWERKEEARQDALAQKYAVEKAAPGSLQPAPTLGYISLNANKSSAQAIDLVK